MCACVYTCLQEYQYVWKGGICTCICANTFKPYTEAIGISSSAESTLTASVVLPSATLTGGTDNVIYIIYVLYYTSVCVCVCVRVCVLCVCACVCACVCVCVCACVCVCVLCVCVCVCVCVLHVCMQ